MREIVLDTETTGLNYRGGDRIIEVACVELTNHIPTGKNIQFYCSTDKKIGEDAIKIHGLTNEFLNKHSAFKEHLKNFFDFIKNDTLIIHNAEFDVGFINNELMLVGAKPITNKIIDTMLSKFLTLQFGAQQGRTSTRRTNQMLSSPRLCGWLPLSGLGPPSPTRTHSKRLDYSPSRCPAESMTMTWRGSNWLLVQSTELQGDREEL